MDILALLAYRGEGHSKEDVSRNDRVDPPLKQAIESEGMLKRVAGFQEQAPKSRCRFYPLYDKLTL
jgi:hypothetical protein